MRRAATAVFLALTLTFVAGAAFSADGLTVGVNQTRRLVLRGTASNVIVSDPAVADVTVLDTHSLLVMGRGYGATGLLVLDRGGRTLFDGQILVAAPEANRVTLHHGNQSVDYACAPRCQALGSFADQGASNSTTTTTTNSTPAAPAAAAGAGTTTSAPAASPGI
ncbi:MAG: pilus assembly protein N-terminal domain-containing protein [Caulobacteraceae bacterium]|nr:pilus assembly protein N-terminal domain-containing protein [Caulobacteraceae bacterium]